MRIVYSMMGRGNAEILEVRSESVRIGRGADNDIVLKSPFVAEHAAMLMRTDGHWELLALGENDIRVGDAHVVAGERVIVRLDQSFQIYPYALRFDGVFDEAVTQQRPREQLDAAISSFILLIHREILDRMDRDESTDSVAAVETDPARLALLERDIEEMSRIHGFLTAQTAGLLDHCAANMLLGCVIANVSESATVGSVLVKSSEEWSRLHTSEPEFEEELDGLTARLESAMNLADIEDVSQKMMVIESEFWGHWQDLASPMYPELKEYLAYRYLKKEIKDIVFGFGPLEDLLRMPNISEIMVVDRDKIYVEKNGMLEKSGRRFVSDDVTEGIIDRIVSRVGRRIDRSQPMVDARLVDGSRVNAVIAPLAVSGPCLTIRKFAARSLSVDDLVNINSLTRTAAEFLKASVISRRNILVSGGTGAGKTTLLNCLSDFIPDKERIVTVEDTAELQLQKEHVVTLETKAANVEGTGEYTIRELVRNALRMRPDRIVVGECRGPEALDMLQAMNTGHDGSMTTIHANHAADVISRIEVLVQMAADLPIESIHRQTAGAVDLIVQLARLRDGRRVVSQITEIVEYDQRERIICMKDLFLLDEHDPETRLMPTGALPTFMGELIESKLIDLQAFYL